MRNLPLILIMSTLPASMGAAPPNQPTVAIVGADILPMTSTERARNQTVLISGDRIIAVGPSGRISVPQGAMVIDGSGKTLTPGLVDMHVHLAPTPGEPGDPAQRALAVMLAHGVTTFRGMSGSPANLIVRKRIEAGELAGPRFYAASPALNDKNTSGGAAGIEAVDRAKADGFDLIKSHELTDVATWKAIEDEAHRVGLPTAGHVTKQVGLPRALAAGEEVEHLDGAIPELLSPATRAKDFGQVPPPEILTEAANASDAQIAELARKVRSANSWQVPTLGLFEKISDFETPTTALAAGSSMRFVPDLVLQQWAAQRDELGQSGLTPQWGRSFTNLRRRIVRAYHDAGVPLMTGSDTAQAFHLWGPALYEEIRAFAQSGLSPLEALKAATVVPRDYFRSLVNGGSALGWRADFGTIEPGARADLDLWQRDPSADLSALDQRPLVVVAGGRVFDRSTLDAMLEKAATDAKRSVPPAAPAATVSSPSKQAFIYDPRSGGKLTREALSTDLAETLSQAGITKIYSARSAAARETARSVARRLGIPVTDFDPSRPLEVEKAVAEMPGSILFVGGGHDSTSITDMLKATPSRHPENSSPMLVRIDLDRKIARSIPVGGPSPMNIRQCHAPGLPLDTICGSIRVPENRTAPTRRQLDIHFAVLPATGPIRDDPLVILPGGPGLGGVQSGGGIAQLFASMRGERDILVIDQRGTGASNPLTCPQGASELNPIAALGEFRASDVVACRNKLERRADLRYYFTREAVRDMEQIRAALAYPRLDLFGMSYGTRVALDYLRLYPTRVGQTVIRAAAPPEMRLPLWSSRDTQTSFHRMVQECLAQPECAARYPDLEGDMRTIISALERASSHIKVRDPTTGRQIEGDLTRDGFSQLMFAMLYIPQTYAALPPLLAKAKAGNFSPLAQAAAPFAIGVGNEIAWGMYWSVLCDEDVRRIDRRSINRATAGTFTGRTPIDHELTACANWPRAPVPADYLRPFASTKPVFIISGYNDPVAGKVWGDVVARTLPNSLHIEVKGAAHLPPLPSCTGDLMEQFLTGTSLHALDTSCIESARPPHFVT